MPPRLGGVDDMKVSVSKKFKPQYALESGKSFSFQSRTFI